MFCKKIHGDGRQFQMLNGCPPLVSDALLTSDIVWNVNEEANLTAALPGLPEGGRTSGDARDDGSFRVTSTRDFEPGKPLLNRSLGGDTLPT